MNKLNNLLQSAMSEAEKKSWKGETIERYSIVLTYAHGGAYFCFRCEEPAQSKHYSRGITEERIKEIIDSLPKKLKPLADGIARGWSVTVRKNSTTSQRIQ